MARKIDNVFGCSEIAKLINACSEMGYTMEMFRPESLGYGSFVLVSPDENHWNFIVEEIYLNEWSSGHTVRRSMKISKKLQVEIDKYNMEMMKVEE